MSTPVELQEIEVRAQLLAERIPLIKIIDAETFALAVEDRREIKYRLARIGELMDPVCQATDRAHKTAVAQRDGLRAPFLAADKVYSRLMGAYQQEQERLRREAEEAARRERERLEAAERARVEAEENRLREIEETRLLNEAAAAEAAGDTETAERILAAPVETPIVVTRPVFVPPPTVEAPKAAGVSFRDNWSAEVTDLLALVRAVAAGQQPITLVKPDMTALNGMARSLKAALRVPGVRAVNERIASQRTAP